MKTIEEKCKEILGKEIWVEYPEGKKYLGFVAQADPNKGITIKALEPEKCPDWFPLEDGSINLFCNNCKVGWQKKIISAIINLIFHSDILSYKKSMLIEQSVGKFEVMGKQSICAFE